MVKIIRFLLEIHTYILVEIPSYTILELQIQKYQDPVVKNIVGLTLSLLTKLAT